MMQTEVGRKRQGFFVFLNLYRWMNWLLALGLLYLRATPAVSPEITLVAYGSVFLYNGFFTLWPRQVESLLRRHPYLIAGDWLFCTALLFAYGWASPFYVYSFSPIMLAGYIFGLRGAFLLAALGATGYGASTSINGLVWAEIAGKDMIDIHLFQIFDYFLVAIFFSYPAALADKLGRVNDELRLTQTKIERLILAEERQRIAQDIHDNVTQSLLGVTLLIDASLAKNEGSAKPQRELALAKEAATTAMSEMREAIDDLFKERLERLTAIEIVEQALMKARHTHGLQARLSTSGSEQQIPAEAKKALYLVVQEAVSNVIKHSGSASIDVDLAFESDYLKLEVIDGGRGFDQENQERGSGLRSMSKRLAELRGTCKVFSGLDLGTKIEIEIPLRQEGALLPEN